MKTCETCKQLKELFDFPKSKTGKYGIRNHCRVCHNKKSRIKHKEFMQRNPWYNSYYHAKNRCENVKYDHYKYYGGKGIKFLLTLKEVKQIWFRDKAYLMKRPSIDRINSNGHYEYSNCQFIELTENISKARRKTMMQFDLNDNFIAEYCSAREAERELGIDNSDIAKSAKGKIKHAGGFIWRYKYV